MDFFGLVRIRRIPRRQPTLIEKYPGFKVGHDTYGEPLVIGEGKTAKLEIGCFCSISDEVVVFLDGEHRSDWVTTYPFSVFWPECRSFVGHPATKGDVRIGNDVWIGYGASILSGVSVRTGAVIAAHAVVTRDVPSYSIVAGNPARVLKFRFAEDIIARLLESMWWDLPRERLVSLMPLLLSNRAGEFLRAVEFSPERARPPSLQDPIATTNRPALSHPPAQRGTGDKV